MSYSEIDQLLYPWTNSRGFHVATAFGDAERRFFYFSDGKSECYQISVEPPEEGFVTVNLWTIETDDDEDFHDQWVVPVAGLIGALDAALKKSREWAARSR